MAEVINLNMFGGETPQASIMPTPSPELAGKILQYAGATDENFTAGYFYRCVTTGGTSSWQRVNVQPSGAGTSWGGIDGDIADQTDLAEALNGKTGRFDVTFVVDTTEQLATKTAVMGDTAIVKTTGKMHTYGSTWDGGVNGEYGVIYIGENEQYVWDTTKFVLISTEDAKTLNGKDEGYFAKDSEAAKRDGSYPLMNVGSADNLTGGFKVSREFSEDTAGGSADIADGVVKVGKIKGNSVVWNTFKIGSTDGITTWTEKGVEISVEDNGIITMNGTMSSSGNISLCRLFSIKAKYNHLIYIKKRSNSYNQEIIHTIYGVCQLVSGNKNKSMIFKVANNIDNYEAFGFGNLSLGTVFDNVKLTLLIVDLTQMFGEGNEPSTVEEFEKMFPLDYYDYNEGEILSLNPTGIKTIGFNAYNHTTGKAYVIGGNQYQITGAYTSITEDGVTITPDSDGKFTPSKNGELTIAGGDSTTTCVHLVWSGKRNGEYEEHWEETRNIPVANINTDGTITESATGKTRLFPDGLCSALLPNGTAIYDEITASMAIKRIAKVDLGTCNCTLVDASIGKFYFSLPSIGKNGQCALLLPGYKNYISISIEDMQIGKYITNNMAIRNKALFADKTAKEVKALMNGVNLYYELAEPIVVKFSEPLNLNYRVSDFGVETLLPINDATPVTAPIKIDVEYGLNVVDTVRNLSRNYLGMSGTQNTFAAIAAALSAYGMSMTLGDYDETNKYYPVTISGGWKPANAVPASATAAGSRGEYYIDAEYFYVCVDDATWKRFALSSW